MKYPQLFSPATIGSRRVQNRVVLAPMGTRFNHHDGSVSDRYVNYLRARAQGGAGLLITENTHLRHELTQTTSLGAYHDRLICGLSRLPHAVHPFGSRIVLQISIHGGTAQQRVIGTRPPAPSAIESPLFPQVPRELSTAEIETVIDAYVQGAYRGWCAGFDGVEVHAAHGYLLTQFVSPHTNRRTDAYGGDFERRMRVPSEIVRRIRQMCGEDFVIGFKFNGYENVPDGVNPTLACRIGRHMETIGVDYLHVASLGAPVQLGEAPDFPAVPSLYTLEPNPLLELAAGVKAEVSIPVIAAGGFNRPEDAEAALAHNAADLIAVGRAFLADPDWGYHALRGRPEAIRPCIKCNQCHSVLIKGHLTRCAINPTLGERNERRISRTDQSKHVVVVGSGPGGMQAALTASARGHRVTLCERNAEVGGNLLIGSLPFFKEDLRRYFDFARNRLAGSNVEVLLNRNADPDLLRSLSPDVVIVASGSEMIPMDLPGGGSVLMVTDVLSGRKPVGDRVVLIGAGFVGCEVGWHLAHEGRRVQLIDILPQEQLLAAEHPVNRATLFYQLQQAGVSLQCNTVPVGISDRGVTAVLPNGKETTFAADSVVSCIGFRPNRKLCDTLTRLDENWALYAIGDCVKVENFYHAVQSAFQLARSL